MKDSNNQKTQSIIKSKIVVFTIGILIGVLAILSVRFATYEPAVTHYHANFAVYVNGQREQFDSNKYYEETASAGCTLEPVSEPVERAHMHGDVNSVVHVHDDLVTWANFFENIEWGLGDDYIKTANGILKPDSESTLSFVLNGKTVKSIAGSVIGDEDTLLISYGKSTADQLKTQYDSISHAAGEVNHAKDPASCSAGSKTITIQDRIDHLF